MGEPERCWLFVYGLLKPGLRPPETYRVGYADRVRGTLVDLGVYPGWLPEPKDRWVVGFTLLIDSVELPALDEYEDVHEGLYERVRVITELGFAAWIYRYRGPLPPNARRCSCWWPRQDSAAV